MDFFYRKKLIVCSAIAVADSFVAQAVVYHLENSERSVSPLLADDCIFQSTYQAIHHIRIAAEIWIDSFLASPPLPSCRSRGQESHAGSFEVTATAEPPLAMHGLPHTGTPSSNKRAIK